MTGGCSSWISAASRSSASSSEPTSCHSAPAARDISGLIARQRRSPQMRAQAAAQVDRLADVERAAAGVLQHVDARRRRRVAADPLAGAAPGLASILEHQRLRDEPARELGRRAADAEHLGGEPLMVGRVAHLGEPGEQAVTKHTAVARLKPSRYG